MTPKQLAAWNELIAREELREEIGGTRVARIAGASARDYGDWLQKTAEEAK